jgi:cell division protease FtsH
VIEEAHELALAVLRERMDELHTISQILIERETIDKDQFQRLLAGEDESSVFPEEVPTVPPTPPEEPRRERQPRPRPFPLPGATMQPPPPDPAKG